MTIEETIQTAAQHTAKADKLSRAKGLVDNVMQDFPEDACGSAWLEEAIELIGRADDEIDALTVSMIEAL